MATSVKLVTSEKLTNTVKLDNSLKLVTSVKWPLREMWPVATSAKSSLLIYICNIYQCYLKQNFPIEKHWRLRFFFGNLATGHFSGKFLQKVSGSGHAESNDTGLKSLACPGAEPIQCQTHTQTFGQSRVDPVQCTDISDPSTNYNTWGNQDPLGNLDPWINSYPFCYLKPLGNSDPQINSYTLCISNPCRNSDTQDNQNIWVIRNLRVIRNMA